MNQALAPTEPRKKRPSGWGRFLIPLFALIYVISPIDIVPEAVLPLVGFLDDAGVLAAALTWWVRQQRDTGDSEPEPGRD